jgi:small-conductance mechanosensitive channel
VHTGDIELAVTLIDQAGQELAADPRLGPLILEPPRAVRVEGLTDKAVLLRVLGKTVPGAQFEVADALRRRIKRAFDAAGLRFGEGGPAPAPMGVPPRP